MAKHGKKYRAAHAKIDPGRRYTFHEAVQLATECTFSKFDETLDIAVRLGVDPRHADQMVRGTVLLPNGLGKTVRVLVFAKGEKVKEALDAGADYAGGDELVDKIKEGWLDFDKTVATPDMMGAVGKIGKVLGPRGLMPNAKIGTVTFDLPKWSKKSKRVRWISAWRRPVLFTRPWARFRSARKSSSRTFPRSWTRSSALSRSAAKGTYLRGIAISTTMGPGIQIDPLAVKAIMS